MPMTLLYNPNTYLSPVCVPITQSPKMAYGYIQILAVSFGLIQLVCVSMSSLIKYVSIMLLYIVLWCFGNILFCLCYDPWLLLNKQ